MTDFVAEVCSNHNNDLDRAISLIDAAANIGCTGVKFQLFRIDKLYASEVLTHPDYDFVRQRRAWELPLDWLPALTNRCQQRGIKFGCTPFYLEAVDQLLPYVDFFKVASYNLLDTNLLAKVAQTGKPIMLSTGMATVAEIADGVGVLINQGCKDLTLLHCVSAYPMPLEQVNGHFLLKLKSIFALAQDSGGVTAKFGWSDHSVDPAVIYWFTMGRPVDVIEFHLDLDGQGWEYGIGHCWLPQPMGSVIKDVRKVRYITKHSPFDVDERDFAPTEATERLWRADPMDGLRPVREMRGKL